jgi:VanZ family protein
MRGLVAKLLFPPPPMRWLIWALYMVAWTTALLVPVPPQPEGSPLTEPDVRFYFSKAVHVSAYTAFALLTGWLRAPVRWRSWLLALLFAHGAATETLQALLPTGRHGCVEDVLLDSLGISIGLALSWKWWRRQSPSLGKAP